jgi:hypothetical protein
VDHQKYQYRIVGVKRLKETYMTHHPSNDKKEGCCWLDGLKNKNNKLLYSRI